MTGASKKFDVCLNRCIVASVFTTPQQRNKISSQKPIRYLAFLSAGWGSIIRTNSSASVVPEVKVSVLTTGHAATKAMLPWCRCQIQKCRRRGKGEDHDGCGDHDASCHNSDGGSQPDEHGRRVRPPIIMIMSKLSIYGSGAGIYKKDSYLRTRTDLRASALQSL